MKHGSLFSGIGGFDLASEWMGWENVFHCEWNPFGQKVLNYYWPNAITYHDITKTDFTIHRGRIDIITGGFPCQPYSSAGKRLGKEDERHLWPEMLRAIREIQPTWIVGENVRGLTNWNGGLVFDEVQSDLEAQGYEVTPFLLPAASVNAPHSRQRIWFIAFNASYSNLFRFDKCIQHDEVNTGKGRVDAFRDINEGNVNGNASDSKNKGLEGMRGKERGYSKLHRRQFRIENWKNFPTVSPICDGNDGLSDRLDRITFPKWRNESIKAGGNAVVPQVVYQIFKAIEKYNELDKQLTI
jgi:DNA (cytosine-5)-methyltransferase 1